MGRSYCEIKISNNINTEALKKTETVEEDGKVRYNFFQTSGWQKLRSVLNLKVEEGESFTLFKMNMTNETPKEWAMAVTKESGFLSGATIEALHSTCDGGDGFISWFRVEGGQLMEERSAEEFEWAYDVLGIDIEEGMSKQQIQTQLDTKGWLGSLCNAETVWIQV